MLPMELHPSLVLFEHFLLSPLDSFLPVSGKKSIFHNKHFAKAYFKLLFLNIVARSCLKGSHWKVSSAHTVLVLSLDRTSPLKEGCFHLPSALLLCLGWREDQLDISKIQAQRLTLPLTSRVTLAKVLHLHSLSGAIIVKSRTDVTKYSIS